MSKVSDRILVLVSLLIVGAAVVINTNFETKPGKSEKESSDTTPDVVYDPEKCKTNAEGMVFLALGRTVIRVPHDEALFIGGIVKNEPFVAPDPSEPEGCPDNPIRGASYKFAYRYKALRDAKGVPAEKMKPTMLRLQRLPPKDRSYESVLRHQFFESKEEFGDCADISPEVVGCRAQKKAEGPGAGYQLMNYMVRPEIYSTPFGRPLFIYCGYSRKCEVSYQYDSEIQVSYRFNSIDLPVENLVLFDRTLRDQIEQSKTKNFPWKNN